MQGVCFITYVPWAFASCLICLHVYESVFHPLCNISLAKTYFELSTPSINPKNLVMCMDHAINARDMRDETYLKINTKSMNDKPQKPRKMFRPHNYHTYESIIIVVITPINSPLNH